MGVSIPALAFPLNAAGEADLTAKPEPVTLFFGIIDFLQVLQHNPGCFTYFGAGDKVTL